MPSGYVAAEDLVWGDRAIARGEPLPEDSASDPALARSVAVGLVAPADEVDDGWEVARRPLVIGERTLQPGERLRPDMRLDRSFVRLRESGRIRRAEPAVPEPKVHVPIPARPQRGRPRAR